MGGSVGGASSVPSPAGLVSMISTVQSMNMKMNLQVGGTPDKMKGLAGGVGWVNLDFSLPKSGHGHRRQMLEQGSASRDPYEQAGSLFVFSMLLFLVPFSLAHHYTQHVMIERKKKPLKGILLFPQIELTIALLLVAPYGKSAATLFSLGTTRGVFAGIGMLLALPIPVLLFSIYIVNKYILHHRAVKYIVFHKIPEHKGLLHIIRQGLLASPSHGFWKEKSTHLMDKYGVFFKSVRGPMYTFENKMVRYDPLKRAYKWGRVIRQEDSLAQARSYYKAYFIVRVLMVSLLLNAFQHTTAGNVAQTILLMLLLTVHVWFMLLVSPLNTPKEQFVDIASNSCELGTYACGFALLMARRLHLDSLVFLSGEAMFLFQVLSIGVQIIAQLWNVVLVFKMLKPMIMEKLFKNDPVNTAHHILLSKKYANRWLMLIHHRPLKEWEGMYRSNPLSTSLKDIHIRVG